MGTKTPRFEHEARTAAVSYFDMRAGASDRYVISNSFSTLKYNYVHGPKLADVLTRFAPDGVALEVTRVEQPPDSETAQAATVRSDTPCLKLIMRSDPHTVPGALLAQYPRHGAAQARSCRKYS